MIKCELTLPRLLDSLLVYLPFGPSHKPRVPVCNKKHNCKNKSIVKTKDESDSQYSKKEREGEMTSMTLTVCHTQNIITFWKTDSSTLEQEKKNGYLKTI